MFWQGSYYSVRVDKLVEQAGVNKASFYQYFKTKEQAALEAVEYLYQRTKSNFFEASFKNNNSPIERLEAIFGGIYALHNGLKQEQDRTPGCPFVNIGNEMATVNEAIRKKIAAVFADFETYHQRIYDDALELDLVEPSAPDERLAMGAQIQSILNGGMINAKINNDPAQILLALKSAKQVMKVKAFK